MTPLGNNYEYLKTTKVYCVRWLIIKSLPAIFVLRELSLKFIYCLIYVIKKSNTTRKLFFFSVMVNNSKCIKQTKQDCAVYPSVFQEIA